MVGLADQLVGLIEAELAAVPDAWDDPGLDLPDDLADLLDAVFLSSVPMAPRLLELLEERGWTGWTKLVRV